MTETVETFVPARCGESAERIETVRRIAVHVAGPPAQAALHAIVAMPTPRP